YIPDPSSNDYIFRLNENIPIFIFMAIIVALFLGLTVSAEEIFRDRKILSREQFLNLSKSSYLSSKVLILLFISAIQSILFVIIANSILEIRGMYFEYWFMLFITAVCANMLGLNISASFNSAVTIYIIIPLLMIPMMILSGAMFPFDKLNRSISSIEKVPMIAEIMPTKWSYEALMVNQYKNNEFEQYFYDLKKQESQANFKQVYYIPEIEKSLEYVGNHINAGSEPENMDKFRDELSLLRNELEEEAERTGVSFQSVSRVRADSVNRQVLTDIKDFIGALEKHYQQEFDEANKKLDNIRSYLTENKPAVYRKIKDNHFNESVSDQVKKVFEKNKIIRYKNELIQHIDPIYHDPEVEGFLSFRSHFFAPRKHFMGNFFGTYWFNIGIIVLMAAILYAALYYNLLYKLLNLPQKMKLKQIIFRKT
ncbi:MAG: ABC transporter permease, partial [Bacteroidota bacterium]